MTRFYLPCLSTEFQVKPIGEQNNYLQSLEVQVYAGHPARHSQSSARLCLGSTYEVPMFDFDEDELARLSLQKVEDKVQENLYEKLVNAQKQATSQKELIHTELAENSINSWISWILGAYMPKHTPYMT